MVLVQNTLVERQLRNENGIIGALPFFTMSESFFSLAIGAFNSLFIAEISITNNNCEFPILFKF